MAPPWAGWFLFIISLNPQSLCNEVGRKPRLWRESLGWSASEPRGLGNRSRPFQPGVPSSAPSTQVSPALSAHTSLCPLLPGLGSQFRLPGGGGGVVLATRCGWREGAEVGGWRGEWVPPPARSGGPGASSHEIPSQGMWSGCPALCQPGASGSRSSRQGRQTPSKPVVLLPAGHPPSHR